MDVPCRRSILATCLKCPLCSHDFRVMFFRKSARLKPVLTQTGEPWKTTKGLWKLYSHDPGESGQYRLRTWKNIHKTISHKSRRQNLACHFYTIEDKALKHHSQWFGEKMKWSSNQDTPRSTPEQFRQLHNRSPVFSRGTSPARGGRVLSYWGSDPRRWILAKQLLPG